MAQTYGLEGLVARVRRLATRTQKSACRHHHGGEKLSALERPVRNYRNQTERSPHDQIVAERSLFEGAFSPSSARASAFLVTAACNSTIGAALGSIIAIIMGHHIENIRSA
jgi:hypothetical protein